MYKLTHNENKSLVELSKRLLKDAKGGFGAFPHLFPLAQRDSLIIVLGSSLIRGLTNEQIYENTSYKIQNHRLINSNEYCKKETGKALKLLNFGLSFLFDNYDNPSIAPTKTLCWWNAEGPVRSQPFIPSPESVSNLEVILATRMVTNKFEVYHF